ncbi:hypothetical protein Tco_0583189 [Tanacetum coccineum]
MVGDVRTLIMEEAHATKYFVRPGTDGQSEHTFQTLENMFRAYVRNLEVVGILTFREAEIGESKMIGLELEQETTKVVVIKERPKEAKDRVVRFDKKGELAPRLIEEFGFVLHRVRSRLVSDSTTRDVEWEPIEEERLEEPKEGWRLGESKKSRMRELVVKYKAEKVCHEEMVKMPLVDLKVLEVYTKPKEEHGSHVKMNLELLKKEKYHVKPNKVKAE